jgi:hypothetical protein
MLKGQSHQILGYIFFSFWKIKLVLVAGLLMILILFFFVVPGIFKKLYLNCFYETLTNCADLTESCSRIFVPAY